MGKAAAADGSIPGIGAAALMVAKPEAKPAAPPRPPSTPQSLCRTTIHALCTLFGHSELQVDETVKAPSQVNELEWLSLHMTILQVRDQCLYLLPKWGLFGPSYSCPIMLIPVHSCITAAHTPPPPPPPPLPPLPPQTCDDTPVWRMISACVPVNCNAWGGSIRTSDFIEFR